MKQLLELKRGKLLEDLHGSFKDHMGYPRSICRHLDPDTKKADRIQTVGSIIMDLNEGDIHFAAGCPCETGYKTFHLQVS